MREHSPLLAERKSSGLTIWHVSRYADVRRLLADARLSKNPQLVPTYIPGPAGLNEHLVHADPPEHTRLRGLVGNAFIARRMAALEPIIRDTATRPADALPGMGTVDLIEDFALPLTFTMICTILGVPVELNTPHTRRLLAATVRPDRAAPGTDRELYDYLVALIDRKRRTGREHGEHDLLAALVHARDNGEGLTEPELIGTACLLLLVGHDTTVSLIGNGMVALLSHPEQAAALRADPALMPSAVEELLRYDSPVRDATFRVATEPIALHDGLIGPGQIVSLLIGSANRDAERFPEPDRLDLRRTPNEHLAFGRGAHFCIGAVLARMEGAIAFSILLDRLRDPRLAMPARELPWRPSRVMRGLDRLPVLIG
ncbi:cytochrome P450 [Pseudonocardiaceae bacterium YIM PH 21723]|nr:cytochrome P450 [Pseudonocardiaceae bacterium YIM PH 21723]